MAGREDVVVGSKHAVIDNGCDSLVGKILIGNWVIIMG